MITGQPLFASGTVPDPSLTYRLCLLPNATWTLGGPFAGTCILERPLTSPTNAFSGVPLGAAPAPGGYDLLLLGPVGTTLSARNASGGPVLLGPAETILAAQEASAAPGLLVGGGAEIPSGGRAGLLGFAFLVAAGAWVLLRQYR